MFLKELVLRLIRTLWGQFLREICSHTKCTPFSCAVNGAIAWILLSQESLHTENFTKILTVLHVRYSLWWVAHFLNRIPVMVPLTALLFRVIFFGGISPSKIIPIAPSWDGVQALSKAHAFLPRENKQRLLCMGRTSTANQRSYLIIALNS
jgi:hypothetical protein